METEILAKYSEWGYILKLTEYYKLCRSQLGAGLCQQNPCPRSRLLGNTGGVRHVRTRTDRRPLNLLEALNKNFHVKLPLLCVLGVGILEQERDDF